MSKLPIHFFNEDTNFKPKNLTTLRTWINNAIILEDFQLDELTFIFCSDQYLIKLNKEFLNHDTFTDIITFDNSTQPHKITGDIFISIERVKENAKSFNTTLTNELNRVIIHGVLHLLGYTDKTKKDKGLMTEKEDFYLKKMDL